MTGPPPDPRAILLLFGVVEDSASKRGPRTPSDRTELSAREARRSSQSCGVPR